MWGVVPPLPLPGAVTRGAVVTTFCPTAALSGSAVTVRQDPQSQPPCGENVSSGRCPTALLEVFPPGPWLVGVGWVGEIQPIIPSLTPT